MPATSAVLCITGVYTIWVFLKPNVDVIFIVHNCLISIAFGTELKNSNVFNYIFLSYFPTYVTLTRH
jgi:drug/metabolite transporter superfamily protein YnfA